MAAGAFARSSLHRLEASEGSKGEACEAADKAAALLPAQRDSAARQPLGPKPATCRQSTEPSEAG